MTQSARSKILEKAICGPGDARSVRPSMTREEIVEAIASISEAMKGALPDYTERLLLNMDRNDLRARLAEIDAKATP